MTGIGRVKSQDSDYKRFILNSFPPAESFSFSLHRLMLQLIVDVAKIQSWIQELIDRLIPQKILNRKDSLEKYGQKFACSSYIDLYYR